ncbi:MAG: DUF2812 domain-containing protein [Oscillospiraceae bacterium]|jgi:hypothetical protein|nr:DUF2812 domain-containing protein [Oscillospiraceae bacterium]
MSTVINRRFFWGWDFEREEKWLNEMSAKGSGLVDVRNAKGIRGFLKTQYTFEDCAPGEWIIRKQFLEKPRDRVVTNDYIHLVRESGAEIFGANWRNLLYARKKADAGPFELIGNIDSRIWHLRKIRKPSLIIVIILAIDISLSIAKNIIEFLKGEFPGSLFSITSFLYGVSAFMGALLLYGVIRTSMMIHKLKKERAIRE